jgi:hypothetical protein
MNKILLIIIFISFSSFFYSQQNSAKKLLTTLGEEQSLSFYEIQKSFNDYWDPYNVKGGYYFESGEKKKAPGWKLFKRWEWYWEHRVNIETGDFPNTTSDIEYEKSMSTLNKVTALNENWVNLGTSSSTGGYAGIGRINCVAFHPSDANTF